MKCRGDGCPKKESCERYLMPEAKVQSWWSMAPYDRVTGECDHFWQAEQEKPDTPWYAPSLDESLEGLNDEPSNSGNADSDTEQ